MAFAGSRLISRYIPSTRKVISSMISNRLQSSTTSKAAFGGVEYDQLASQIVEIMEENETVKTKQENHQSTQITGKLVSHPKVGLCSDRRIVIGGTDAEGDATPSDRDSDAPTSDSGSDAPPSDAGSDGEGLSSNVGESEAEADSDENDVNDDTLQEFILNSKSPKEIVEVLDDYIVGQKDAKKAVAVALRNRWRRQQLPSDMRAEIIPKNILMLGPTGCGKTEIARRMSKLAEAPFVKVEATKFTEVGFHGRDVDTIIRDLVDNSIALTKKQRKRRAEKKVREAVELKILSALVGKATVQSNQHLVYLEYLRNGQLDGQTVEIEVPSGSPNMGAVAIDPSGMQPVGLNEIIGRIGKAMNSQKSTKKTMKVKEAKKVLSDLEMEKLLESDDVNIEAIENAQQNGIVFIDEIDKICTAEGDRMSGDASAEGVQRDLLPLIEGSTITTKYGNIDTNFILFVCSGAFHQCKPADLLPELQGRLPIRVELDGLDKSDLYKILTEPSYSLIKQQIALLSSEGVDLSFSDDALHRIAEVAADMNTNVENIGARRLNTVLERIMEELSFGADELKGEKFEVDVELVEEKVGSMMKKIDLSKFIL